MGSKLIGSPRSRLNDRVTDSCVALIAIIPIYVVTMKVAEFHAMRAFALAFLLYLPSLAAAQPYIQHNPYTNGYEYAPKGATPRYNPYAKQRELVGPGEVLQYNAYTRKREYAPRGAMPRYNPYTRQRQLVGPD